MDVNFELKIFKNISSDELENIISENFYMSIVLVENGTLSYFHNKEEYSLNEGEVLLIPQYCDFSLGAAPVKKLKLSVFSYFLQFDKIPVLHFSTPGKADASSRLSLALKSYFNIKNDENYKTALLKKSLEYEIIHLAETLSDNSEMCVSRKIQPVLSYIQKNLGRNFSVYDMAKDCGMSESAVYKLFNECLGQAPKQFIRKKRMEYALHLLRNTNLSISEISFESGFYDQYYFSKEFKKIFSSSPSFYRKNIDK